MPMKEEFESQGKWLFRWRSYLPIVFVFLLIPSFLSYRYPLGNPVVDEIWEVCCFLIGFLGRTIRALSVGYAPKNTSGRNTREQIADALNTTGMYSLVRNPLYLGNFFMWAAPILFLHTWWLCVIYGLVFMLYYERIIFTEEVFLRKKFGQEYLDWAARTPAFFPRSLRWVRPEIPFSWKAVIRREYHGFYGLIAVMAAMEHLGEIVVHDKFVVDPAWAIVFGFGTAVYLFIRYLVKRTSVLAVEGR